MEAKLLADLLSKEGDDEEEVVGSSGGVSHPGMIGGARSEKVVDKKEKVEESKDIWEDDELEDGGVFYDDPSDDRTRPEYEVLYKQRVTTEDVFLGVDFERDPSSSSCENLVIRVILPGCKSNEEVDLDVKPNSVKVLSKKYKLVLPLPRKVNEKKGAATWNKEKEMLEVTLQIEE